MTVWHHSAHGEADVRVGVGFYNLKKLKAGDPKIKEFVLGSHRHPTGVVKVEIKIGRRNAHHRVLMETRAFKPQSLGAWPAHGGFVGLAPSMMGDEKWRGLLKTLQPRLANAALRNINAPHRLMMLLQGSPVLAAYGLIASGGTTLPDLDADDDDAAADVPFRSVPIELEVELPKEHPEVVKKVRIEGGTRAVTFFQAAFGRPMQSADDILAYHQQHAGIMGADVWLNLFCKAIALALNGTRYESLRVWREKERLRVIEERDHARAIAASLARQAAQQAGRHGRRRRRRRLRGPRRRTRRRDRGGRRRRRRRDWRRRRRRRRRRPPPAQAFVDADGRHSAVAHLGRRGLAEPASGGGFPRLKAGSSGARTSKRRSLRRRRSRR